MRAQITIIHRHGMGNCGRCAARSFCTTICDEAEAWVNQDYVPQREETIGLPILPSTDEFVSEEDDDEPEYTPMQKAIVTLLLRGYKKSRIIELLDINDNAFRQQIYKIKRKSNNLS